MTAGWLAVSLAELERLHGRDLRLRVEQQLLSYVQEHGKLPPRREMLLWLAFVLLRASDTDRQRLEAAIAAGGPPVARSEERIIFRYLDWRGPQMPRDRAQRRPREHRSQARQSRAPPEDDDPDEHRVDVHAVRRARR